MQSTRPNQPTPGAFYMFVSDMESNGPRCGVRFNNLRQLLSPPCVILRPQEGGFPSMLEQPQMTYDPSAGPEPRDLEPGFGGYWLVSEQLHDVMCLVDPNAFAFAEVDYRLPMVLRGRVASYATLLESWMPWMKDCRGLRSRSMTIMCVGSSIRWGAEPALPSEMKSWDSRMCSGCRSTRLFFVTRCLRTRFTKLEYLTWQNLAASLSLTHRISDPIS